MTIPTFDVYQQFPPVRTGETDAEGNDLYSANLLHVGEIQEKDAQAALDACRKMTRFKLRSRSSLMRWPIVEDVNGPRMSAVDEQPQDHQPQDHQPQDHQPQE